MADRRAPPDREREKEVAAACCWASAASGPRFGPAQKGERKGAAAGSAAGVGRKREKKEREEKGTFSRIIWSLGNFGEMQTSLNSNFKHYKSFNKICKDMNAQTCNSYDSF